MQVAVSVLIGVLAGLADHMLLLRWIARNKRKQVEPLSGIGVIYSLRYLISGLILVLIAVVTDNAVCIVAGALGLVLTLRAASLVFYARTGGTLQ